jgi:hypothetical protein
MAQTDWNLLPRSQEFPDDVTERDRYGLRFDVLSRCLQALQERIGRGRLGEAVRDDFPILTQEVNNKPLIYLDNAATSQKPTSVIDSIMDYYNRQACLKIAVPPFLHFSL